VGCMSILLKQHLNTHKQQLRALGLHIALGVHMHVCALVSVCGLWQRVCTLLSFIESAQSTVIQPSNTTAAVPVQLNRLPWSYLALIMRCLPANCKQATGGNTAAGTTWLTWASQHEVPGVAAPSQVCTGQSVRIS
jgi:hypothetical protein